MKHIHKYISDTTGELIPTVIVQFNSCLPDLWMTKSEYENMGKMKGLMKSGHLLKDIVKVHQVLKNPSKYPAQEF